MNSDASIFVRRARFFLAELKARKHPNATTIQDFDDCSRSTATRFITRLQDEFLFPIRYDESERGYVLTDQSFTCEFLPPGKDEFSALFLLKQLADTVGAEDVKNAVTSLWNSAVSNSRIHFHDINTLTQRFSADLTAVTTVADTGVLSLLDFAATGTPIEMTYKSPWRHRESKVYRGYIEKVHLSDGSVYVLLRSDDGRELVLNASFVKAIKKLDEAPEMTPQVNSKAPNSWLEGFGIWASDKMEEVIITIAPPAAEFYAAQKWHADQVDSWDGVYLVRKMPAILSPELVRRILSLGRHVTNVSPPELKRMVREELEFMTTSI